MKAICKIISAKNDV